MFYKTGDKVWNLNQIVSVTKNDQHPEFVYIVTSTDAYNSDSEAAWVLYTYLVSISK